MSSSDELLRTLLVQKKATEDEWASRLQAALAARSVLISRRLEAEEEHRLLRAQQSSLSPGRRLLRELQREEVLKKRTEEAGLLVGRLQREEARGVVAVEAAQQGFTLAAQERRVIESVLEERQKKRERALDQKQEEERDEAASVAYAHRLLRALRGAK